MRKIVIVDEEESADVADEDGESGGAASHVQMD